MNRTIRTGITTALLAGGLAGLATVSSATPGGDEEAAPLRMAAGSFSPSTVFKDMGRIELATDPGGKMSISYFETVDGSTPAERITYNLRQSDKCLIDQTKTTTGGKKILGFVLHDYSDNSTAGETGTWSAHGDQRLGLVDNGIGSYEQNNCNQSNGRLEAGKAIEFHLGDYFSAQTFVDWAEFDIEGKFGADFEATTDADGTSKWFDPLGRASDNNPDSGGADNDVVLVGSPASADDNFRTIVIAPVSADGRGQLALEGGGDYDLSSRSENRTVLYLAEPYEYALVCHAPTTDTDELDLYEPNGDGTVKGVVETSDDDDWFTVTGTAEPTQARLFRYYGYVHTDGDYGAGEYPTPKTDCDAIGATLSADTPGVLLEPSDDDAFLRVELTWVVPADEVDDTNDPRFDRTIDPDGEGPLGPVPAQYCEGFGPSSATSDPDSAFDPTDPGVADHVLVDTNGSEFVPWCVISDERVVTGDVIVQTMVWDGIGDPYWN